MYDIITIGSASRDVIIKSKGFSLTDSAKSETGQIECFPLGSKIDIDEIAFTTGGGATNSAVTFARQGLRVATVAAVGEDSVAKEVLRELEAEKVDTCFFQTHNDDYTAFSAILVHDSGERTILNYKGEAQHLNADKIDFSKLKTNWFYITSLGGNIELLEKIVDHAKKENIKIAVNLGMKDLELGPVRLKDVLEAINIFICNEEEGRKLVGGQSKEEILSKLRELMSGTILVLTDGRDGVLVEDAGGKKYSAGIPDSPVIERTGAGDAFGSGFVSKYMENSNIEKAIQFGTANASSVVTKFGAKEGILKKEDWGPWPLVSISEF